MAENPTPVAVVILAAGQGTRMKSATPKVLHQIGGLPLIGHVLRTASALAPERAVVVVRHERDLVADAVTGLLPGVDVVDQDEIPGTGRAVELALAALDGFDGDVLVLSADVPLVEVSVVEGLLARHRAAAACATLLCATLDDATGYGRVIRGADGAVERIARRALGAGDQHRNLCVPRRAVAHEPCLSGHGQRAGREVPD
jgi:bifunctional UDP-N-acetylglucosamine pyrophosphorylase/glucosamine-1-phosphate N-acetyltransferase